MESKRGRARIAATAAFLVLACITILFGVFCARSVRASAANSRTLEAGENASASLYARDGAREAGVVFHESYRVGGNESAGAYEYGANFTADGVTREKLFSLDESLASVSLTYAFYPVEGEISDPASITIAGVEPVALAASENLLPRNAGNYLVVLSSSEGGELCRLSLTVTKRPVSLRVNYGNVNFGVDNRTDKEHKTPFVYGCDITPVLSGEHCWWEYAEGSEPFLEADPANLVTFDLKQRTGSGVYGLQFSESNAFPAGDYHLIAKLTGEGRINYELKNAGADTSGVLKVDRRRIEVAIDAEKAQSSYGDAVTLYATDTREAAYTVKWYNPVGRDEADWLLLLHGVTSERDLFTFTPYANSASVPGTYDISLERTGRSSNYQIYYVTSTAKWKVNNAEFKAADGSEPKATGNRFIFDGLYHPVFDGLVEGAPKGLVSVDAVAKGGQAISWRFATRLTSSGELLGNNGRGFEFEPAPENKANSMSWNQVVSTGTITLYVRIEAQYHNPLTFQYPITATVTRGEVKVTVNHTIYYGEESPLNFDGTGKAYLGSLTEFRTENAFYTFEGIPRDTSSKNTDWSRLFDPTNTTFITADSTFSYAVEGYQKGSPAGEYQIKFTSHINCPSYDFVDSGMGKLTVLPAPVTVTLNRLTHVYYGRDNAAIATLLASENADPALGAFTIRTEQTNSYGLKEGDKLELISIYRADETDYDEIFTLATFATQISPVSDGENETAYPIYLSERSRNFIVTVEVSAADAFTGEAPEGALDDRMSAYVVTRANLTFAAEKVTPYSAVYDEEFHAALQFTQGYALRVDDGDERVTGKEFALAYYVLPEGSAPPEESDYLAFDWSEEISRYIDTGVYTVCFRIMSESHHAIYGCRTAEITKAENAVTGEFNFANGTGSSVPLTEGSAAAWNYGLYTERMTDGYNASEGGNHSITLFTLQTKFRRVHAVNAAEAEQKRFLVTLYRGDEPIQTEFVEFDVTKEGECAADLTKLQALFAGAMQANVFSAGNYKLRFFMGDETNFGAAEASFYFRVGKRALTVQANAQTIVFGESKFSGSDLSFVRGMEYPYEVTGYAAYYKNGELAQETRAVFGENAPVFQSEFALGWEHGTVKEGGYPITLTNRESAVAAATDYEITFSESAVTVEKRALRIEIRSYNPDLPEGYGKLNYGRYGNISSDRYELDFYFRDSAYRFYYDDAPFTLYCDAWTRSVSGAQITVTTNEIGTYPIYAKFNTDRDYAGNYDVLILNDYAALGIGDVTLPEGAIGAAEGAAGAFLIAPTPLRLTYSEKLQLYTPPAGEGAGTYVDYPAGSPDCYRYDGKQKGVSAQAGQTDPNGNPVLFFTQYFIGTGAVGEAFDDPIESANWTYSAPKNAGSYYFRFVTENKNYLWNREGENTSFAIAPRVLTYIPSFSVGGNAATEAGAAQDAYSYPYLGQEYAFTCALIGVAEGEELTVEYAISKAQREHREESAHNAFTLFVTGADTYRVALTIADGEEGASRGLAANYEFSAQFDFTIERTRALVSVADATVQYGTALTESGGAVAGRFAGFTLVYGGEFVSAGGVQVSVAELAQGEFERGLLHPENARYLVTSDGTLTGMPYGATAEEGSVFSVLPSGVTADNLLLVFRATGKLTVTPREIEVKVLGAFDGNSLAKGVYSGENHQQYLTRALSSKDEETLRAFFAPVGEDWAGDSRDTLVTIVRAISLTVTNAVNARLEGYDIAASFAEGKNYRITFLNAEGVRLTEEGATQPKYVIEKAPLTVSARLLGGVDTVVYGNSITSEAGVAYIVNGNTRTPVAEAVYEGFVNREGSEKGYTQAIGGETAIPSFEAFRTDGEAKIPYAAWVSHAGETVEIAPKDLVLYNYEITYRSASLRVVSRKVTARVLPATYEEEREGSLISYHDGVYGAPREAELVFFDASGSLQFASGHLPNDLVESVVYNTTEETYGGEVWQEAGKAPRSAGEYTITVTFKKYEGASDYDYIFDCTRQTASEGDTVSVTEHEVRLVFRVAPKAISDFLWEKRGGEELAFREHEPIQNKIANFNPQIMQVERFMRTVVYNGESSSQRYPYTVSSNRMGLSVEINELGDYAVTVRFKESALKNYTFASNSEEAVSTVTLSFRVAMQATVFTVLDIEGWVYGQYDPTKNRASAELSPKIPDVRFTYSYAAAEVASGAEYRYNTKYFEVPSGVSVSAFYEEVPTEAGIYVLCARYAGSGESYTSAVAYCMFEIKKANPVLPAFGEKETVYTGDVRSAFLYCSDQTLRMVYDGDYEQNEEGATVSALHAGSYPVTFALRDPNNYEWPAGTQTVNGNYVLTYLISPATDNEVTFTVAEGAVYGGEIMYAATSTYAGADGIVYSFAQKTGDGAPTSEWDWFEEVPVRAGQYWLRAVRNATSDYNRAEKITSFEITKAIIRVTPSGTLTYGERFEEGEFSYAFGGFMRGEDESILEGVPSCKEIAGEIGAGSHKLSLNTDGDTVLGVIDPTGNYILVAADGELTVAKKRVYIRLNKVSVPYWSEPDFEAAATTATLAGDSALAFRDTVADLGIEVTAPVTREANVGTYVLSATGYSNENYEIEFIDGFYLITPLEIKVEIVTGGGVYGGEIANARIARITAASKEGEELTEAVDLSGFVFRYTGISNAGASYEGAVAPQAAGVYEAVVTGANSNFELVEPSNTVPFVIEKRVYDEGELSFRTAVYTGKELLPEEYLADSSINAGGTVYTVAKEAYVNRGVYDVALTLVDPYNTKWANEEGAVLTLSFEISVAPNAFTGEPQAEDWVYGESARLPVCSARFGSENFIYYYAQEKEGEYTAEVPNNAGDYWVKIAVPATENYEGCESIPVSFTIEKRVLALPELVIVTEGEGKNDTYTGEELRAEIAGFDSRYMRILYDGIEEGEGIYVTATNANTYAVTIALTQAENYRFAAGENGSGEEVTLTWVVARKKIAMPKPNDQTYTVNGGTLTYLPEGFDPELMQISGNETSNGGTYEAVISLKDPQNYEWEGRASGEECADVTIAWNVVGWDSVFRVLAGVLGGLTGGALLAAGLQCVLHGRRKRLEEAAEAEAEAQYLKEQAAEGEAQSAIEIIPPEEPISEEQFAAEASNEEQFAGEAYEGQEGYEEPYGEEQYADGYEEPYESPYEGQYEEPYEAGGYEEPADAYGIENEEPSSEYGEDSEINENQGGSEE